MPHEDLAAERAHLQFAVQCLAGMRARTLAKVENEDILAANEADADAVKYQLQRRIASFDADAGVLCFGRIDVEEGDVYHVGRRHVQDEHGHGVVIDWRAEAATPFYRATLADPQGLARRRRFVFTGRELTDIFEEDFDDPDSLAGSGGVPDPLLAELSRARTGRMRDIVATIQAEQDEIIRAPLERCLVVQGGPGTGKTAVGLHRAAFLLYEHRDLLSRSGVLVVGPNPVFLRYISQVLPSLGETSATQTTVDALLGLRFRVAGADSTETAAIKGDARMAVVIARAAEDAIRVPEHGLELVYRLRMIRIGGDDLRTMVKEVRARDVPFATQRLRFREALVRRAYNVYTGGEALGLAEDEFGADLLTEPRNRKAVDATWKPVNAIGLVRALLTQRAALARAADGVLATDEQALLLRRRPAPGAADPWTPADLALLDEAETQVKGRPRRYGHVVVDEAQDVSPMQLRMLARRARHSSMTLLGDLAQATAPAATSSWATTLAHLGAPAQAQQAELTIGYRVPGSILDLANRLLPTAAPGVTAAQSARPSGDPPETRAVAPDACLDVALDRALALAAEFTTTAIIAADERVPELVALVGARGVSLAEPGDLSLDHPLTIVPASLAKGLEFDAVIVVEPSEVAVMGAHGLRLLYVALTRAVQHLTIVHAHPLPPALLRR